MPKKRPTRKQSAQPTNRRRSSPSPPCPSRKKSPTKPPRRRFWGPLIWRLALVVLVFLSGYLVWVDLTVRATFDTHRWASPARLYARPLLLQPGKSLSADEFEEELILAGYHQEARLDRSGSYHRTGQQFSVIKRPFTFWDGKETMGRIELQFRGGRLNALQDHRGKRLSQVRFEPALIGHIYPSHQEDRIPVTPDQVPVELIDALIAIEDRDFYYHWGVSPRAIARAAYENLKSGATVQGGSTLTQQLVKNFFLQPERSLVRKLHEAVFALLLEARYEKDEILAAYLNEIYLGQQGRQAIHGFGSAAHFYFARPLGELRLSELALLVALARGASYYNPRRHPQRALARRNLVLDVMRDWGFISPREANAARAQPLGVVEVPPAGSTPFPAFVELVRWRLAEDYHLEDLQSEGLRIFTTLDMRAQRDMEQAVDRRLATLERAKKISPGQLQVASVVSEIETGKVLVLVGGRDPGLSGFNRALHAVRPIGSLIKPAVYLTALEDPHRYTLATTLRDEAVRIRRPNGDVWAPKNYDEKFHGRVPLMMALANSYNLATVQLGMALGVPKVLRTLKRLGVKRKFPSYPSTLLGTVALSPFEVTEMYQTIASGGLRTPLWTVLAVTDTDGVPLKRYAPAITRTFDAGPMFLLNHALQTAMDVGTGRSIYARFDASFGFAGKTGTSNDLRDSWFSGFDRDRLAVVWIGLDDNQSTGITGAGGALALWGDFMALTGSQPRADKPPHTIERHWTDMQEGVRIDRECPQAESVPYLIGSALGYASCESMW